MLRIRRENTSFWLWVGFLSIFIVGGLYAAFRVFTEGLVVTNLSDLVPWGLWITIDLSSIALSAGAFTLCAAVYILRLKNLQPLARTASFIGVIGYSMAMLCLLMDIGQPIRFWHGFVFWNTHSVLWEVTMCVGLYFSVLLLEVIPILADMAFLQAKAPRLVEKMKGMHRFAPYLAIAGLFLSMLHQSSLGATYGVLKARPLWYSPGLSIMFMASAIVGGISMTLLVSLLAERLTPRAKVDMERIKPVALFVGWALVVYLYMRFWYAFSMTYTYVPGRNEGLSLLTSGPLSLNFWFGEIIFGALIPAIILLRKRTRENPRCLMLAFGLVVIGVIFYRWDVNLAGLLVYIPVLPNAVRVLYTTYTPSLIEILAGAGVVAYGALAITLGIRYLHVVDHRYEEHHETVPDGVFAAAD